MRLHRRNLRRSERLRRRGHDMWHNVVAATWIARRLVRHGRPRRATR